MYLTDFLGARVSTMLRTRRSIMRLTLRHFRRLIREYKEREAHAKKELQQHEDTGDVDEMLKTYDAQLTGQLKAYQELAREEKNVFMAEFRLLDDPQEVAQGFAGLAEHLEKLKKSAAHKEFAEKLQALITDPKNKNSLYAKLIALEEKEQKEAVRLQYRNVLRQEKQEKGQLQALVITPSNVMNAVNQLWELRWDSKKEDNILNELKMIEERSLKHLQALEEAVQKGELDKVPKLKEALLTDTKTLQKDFDRFLELYREVLKEFLLFTKDATHIFFMFREEDVFLNEFREHLVAEGFPEEDARKLQQELQDENKKITDIYHTLSNVYRRGARKYEQNMSVKAA